MKITCDVQVNLKTKEVQDKVNKASKEGLRDVVVDIHNDVVYGSPVKTGHNSRSIASEVSGMGTVTQGADATPEKIVDDSKLEAAIYSTSGYGGYLETGTVKMNARPYFKPALDRNFHKLPEGIKTELGRGG